MTMMSRRLAIGAVLVVQCTAVAAAPGFTNEQICKAAIGGVMGRNPATIAIDRTVGDVIYLSYVRPNDRKNWAYKCRIEGSKIIWGNPDGRWMDNPADSRLTYAVDSGKLVVKETFSDGSGASYPYSREALGK